MLVPWLRNAKVILEAVNLETFNIIEVLPTPARGGQTFYPHSV